MAHDVFISHSNDNIIIVRKVETILKANNITCFISEKSVSVSEEWKDRIVTEIKECNLFIIITSKFAVESKYVSRELGEADNANKPIFQIRVDKHPLSGNLSLPLQGIQHIENDRKLSNISRIVSYVCEILNTPPPPNTITIKKIIFLYTDYLLL
ncbi:MAG: toll/interleukin-1 receptor domain-containing protein [Bacteroidales bacterium]